MYKHHKKRLAFAISSIICLSADSATVLFDSVADDGTLCTLREAIESVNNGALKAGCLNFGEDFGVNDTVKALLINKNPKIVLNGEIIVTRDLILDAKNLSTLTVDGNKQHRVFDISNLAIVAMDNVTVSGGSFVDSGGGVRVRGGAKLTLNDCTVSGNSSEAKGGGISVISGSSLILANCIVSNNQTDQGGGGVVVQGGSWLEIEKSTVSKNKSIKGAGGILVEQASLHLSDSTVRDNSASSIGGGVSASGEQSVVSLQNVTISGNSSSSGAGMSIESGATLSLYHSTVTGNSASLNGGGLSLVSNSTQAMLVSNIISGNFAASKGHEVANFNAVIATNSNLLGEITLDKSAAFKDVVLSLSDIIATSDGTQPTVLTKIVEPLANNGGLTLTHGLPVGSPAIGSAYQMACPGKDQRGQIREAFCDIGAFEYQDESGCFVTQASNGHIVTFCL